MRKGVKSRLLHAYALFGILGCYLPQANAIVIFDNFGPDDSSASFGPSIGKPLNQSVAAGFTPPSSGFLTDIYVAIGKVSENVEVQVSLLDDSGGVPGNSLESFILTDLPKFSGSTPPVHISASGNTFLDSDTQYWLAAFAISSLEQAAWNTNNISDIGPYAILNDRAPGSWRVFNSFFRTAFRVAVPEPSILALMGIGLAGMGLVRKRKKT